MRADAARNLEKLRAAATEMFQEHGLQVSLRDIAAQAGVSHGTLYNLFGSREALINEVVSDLAAETLGRIGAEALEITDPWQGFEHYVHSICEIYVFHPAIADVLSGRYPQSGTLMELCKEAGQASLVILQRAIDSGQLRKDFTGDDMALSIGAIAALARATAPLAPEAWQRSATFMLDGLRARPDNTELGTSDLSPDQVYAALNRLNGAN